MASRKKRCALLLGLSMLAAGGSLAYDPPNPQELDFEPAAIVLDDETEGRLPQLLVALATDFPEVAERERAKALAVAMRLYPDDPVAREANLALKNGLSPFSQDIGLELPDAVNELWRIASHVHTDALTDDEQKLGLYLMAVVLAFTEKDDPRFARARKLLKGTQGTLWKNVLQ